MEIKKTTAKAFHAVLTLGLEVGYTQKTIRKDDVYQAVSDFQRALMEREGIYLSASICECDIVLGGQCEKHLQLKFINYPKFPLQESVFKKQAEALAARLMEKFGQNRVVVEFWDETAMFERSEEIDGRIHKKNK